MVPCDSRLESALTLITNDFSYKKLQEYVKKMSDYVIEGGLIWAATPKWRTIGRQCFVVREVPGSNPGRSHLFFDPSLSKEVRVSLN